MSKKYWLFLLLAAVTILFMGNSVLYVTDSVESNYALTAKEMVLSGDWLSPQIYGRYWFDKPILFYWLTALGFKLFGFNEFGARFFPAVFGFGAICLAAYGGTKLYNERVGWLSGFILLSSVEFFLISKSIITDAVLFLFFSAALLFFYLGYRENRKSYWYAMYISAGLAVLTKGPIGVLLPGMIIVLFLLWQRDWQIFKKCHLFSGILLFIVVAFPWYIAMYTIHGSEFINTFFGVHNYLRATVSEHPRDNVIYYYTLVNILALFPWCLLIPWVLWRRLYEHNYHIQAREGFLLIWIGAIFFFFQSMATKYITYTYPLLFPAAIILGHILDKYGDKCLYKGFNQLFVAFLTMLVGSAWWCNVQGILPVQELYLLPAGLLVGILLYYAFQYMQVKKFIGVGCICLCFYLSLIYAVAVPLTEYRSGKELGLTLKLNNVSEVGAYGSYPTSAVFYSDAKIYKLLKRNDIDSYRPHAMSWSSKNVMPYAVMEEANFDSVAVKYKNLRDFYRAEGAMWQPVGYCKEWILLEHKKL